MINNSMNVLSNTGSIVADDFAMRDSTFYNYPYVISGPIDNTWLSVIQSSISTMGFASGFDTVIFSDNAVSLDPASFGNATANTVNAAAIASLTSLLTSLNQSGNVV